MKLQVVATEPLAADTPLLAVPVPQAGAEDARTRLVDEATGGVLRRLLEDGDLGGRAGDEVVLYREGGGPRRLLFVGVGKEDRIDAESVRRFLGRAVRAAERVRATRVSAWLDPLDGLVEPARMAQAAAEGAAVAAWSFREMRAPDPDNPPPPEVTDLELIVGGGSEAVTEAAHVGLAIAEGQNFARTLQSRPGNVATPSHLAEEARAMARGTSLTVRVLDESDMEREGMHALLAVSRGSREEARLIVLEHRGGGEGEAPLVLVGKGLTFDAGGISLKPAAGMESMKFDMSGGAAVLGTMKVVAALNLPVNVVGVVPSSENLPSGSALKPGDVIRTRAGKTVEVINTDAEGRLILADALSFAADLKPAAMVDCATLTGAVVVGLGRHAAAVLGNDDALVEQLREAGERSGERCWPLPLWDDYRRQLDSETADLVNVGGRPGGTITAAAFLREFVGDAPWAHLDIAGTAYGDGTLPYQRKGGYGFPVRLLAEWIRARAG